MLKLAVLVGWDNIKGPVVEAKYPDTQNSGEDQLLIQYLSLVQSFEGENLIEITGPDSITYVYGNPKLKNEQSPDFNYNFIILTIDDDEGDLSKLIRSIIPIMGPSLIGGTLKERKKSFETLLKVLAKKQASKILFMGFPNAGKTSTRKFIFEYLNEDNLLNTSLPPTLGMEISYYNLLKMNISLFDAAGQTLEQWFDPDERAIEGSDLVIFFFSVEDWNEKKEEVINALEKLHERIGQIGDNENTSIQTIVFCHKIDVAEEMGDDYTENLKEEVRKELARFNFPVFFTSIKEGANQDLIIGIQRIFEEFSPVLVAFQDFIRPLLSTPTLIPLALLDNYMRPIMFFPIENEPESSQKNNENSVEELKSIYSECELKEIIDKTKSAVKNLSFNEKPPVLLTFSDNIRRYMLVALNFNGVFGDFSYFIFELAQFGELEHILQAFKKLNKRIREQKIDKSEQHGE